MVRPIVYQDFIYFFRVKQPFDLEIRLTMIVGVKDDIVFTLYAINVLAYLSVIKIPLMKNKRNKKLRKPQKNTVERIQYIMLQEHISFEQ